MMQDGKNLDGLFERYRAACPVPEGSADFMPKLWQKVDARRSFTFQLRSYTRWLVSVASVCCLGAFLFELSPYSGSRHQVYAHTYVEILNDDNSPEHMAFDDAVRTGHPVFLMTSMDSDLSRSVEE